MVGLAAGAGVAAGALGMYAFQHAAQSKPVMDALSNEGVLWYSMYVVHDTLRHAWNYVGAAAVVAADDMARLARAEYAQLSHSAAGAWEIAKPYAKKWAEDGLSALGGGAKWGAAAAAGLYAKEIGSHLMRVVKKEETPKKAVSEIEKFHDRMMAFAKESAKMVGRKLGLVDEPVKKTASRKRAP
jgi:hypothetical protein